MEALHSQSKGHGFHGENLRKEKKPEGKFLSCLRSGALISVLTRTWLTCKSGLESREQSERKNINHARKELL